MNKKPRADHVGHERSIFLHNKAILRKTARTCALCGLPLLPEAKWPDPMCTCIDHIIPVVYGGRSTIDNLQAVHKICNEEKGKKLFVQKKTGGTQQQQHTFEAVKSAEKIPQYVDWAAR